MEKDSYQKKVSKPEYRHLTLPSTTRKKYYYATGMGGATSSHPSIQPTGLKLDNVVILTMKTGSTYEGQINGKGERHGYGIYRVIFAGRYEGEWKNGFKHGSGTAYFKDGTVQYEGLWEGGEPHGKGILYHKDGRVAYDGIWRNGKSKHKIIWTHYH